MRVSRPVRLLALALGLLTLLAVTAAPSNDKPEQISATNVTWDAQADELVLQFGVQRSAIDPDPDCPSCTIREAAIATEIDVYQNDVLVAELRPPLHPIETRPGALQTQGRYVPIAPQRVPWDRNGGTLTGEVLLKIHIQLVWEDDTNRPPSPATFTEWGILLV